MYEMERTQDVHNTSSSPRLGVLEELAMRINTYHFTKKRFSIKDSFSKFDQIRIFLVTFTGEILNGKLRFLCREISRFVNCFKK